MDLNLNAFVSFAPPIREESHHQELGVEGPTSQWFAEEQKEAALQESTPLFEFMSPDKGHNQHDREHEYYPSYQHVAASSNHRVLFNLSEPKVSSAPNLEYY